MFGLFNKDKKNPPQNANTAPSQDPATESLLRAIAEKKKQDPMIGLKMGAQELNTRLLAALKNDKGVHIETLLTTLGALAGFACQMAIREELISTAKATEDEVFTIVKTDDGNTYFMGGLLNKPLIENKSSVWAIVGGAVQQAEGELPDLAEIASYGTKSLGKDNFGIPRVDQEKHKSMTPPLDLVREIWPVILPTIDLFCDRPMERPILIGLAIQKIIIQAKDTISPNIAATIVMDTAVATSKVNPQVLGL